MRLVQFRPAIVHNEDRDENYSEKIARLRKVKSENDFKCKSARSVSIEFIKKLSNTFKTYQT